MTSHSDSERQTEHVAMRRPGRRRFLAHLCKSYLLASIVVWLVLLIISAVAMPEELRTLRGWGLLISAPLVAPLAVPAMILFGLGNLAKYGNKDGSNAALALATFFAAIWVIFFYLFRWRSMRRNHPTDR
jgi:hypothetical protein